MTNEHPVPGYGDAVAGGVRLGWFAAAAALALAAAVGVWGWSGQRRADLADRAVAGAFAERDAAEKAAGQWKGLLDQAEEAARSSDRHVADLEHQVQTLEQLLQDANGDIKRLEAAAAAPAAAPPQTEVVVAPAVAVPQDQITEAEPEPAPDAPPARLNVVFEVNSSYLPGNLDGRLRDLAAGLDAGSVYAVALTGSVGSADVDGRTPEEALRYNHWMAERRMGRIAEFLQKNARAERLEISQGFAMNDPSRRVVVEITPISD